MVFKLISVIVASFFIAVCAFTESFNASELLASFPYSFSDKARAAFCDKVESEQLSPEQAGALIWQLIAEGETLLSEENQQEMGSFYWKAFETLTPEEQMFIAKVNLKVNQGQGFSFSDQMKASTLMLKGFGNLSDKVNDRFLELRRKSIELALLNPIDAAREFKSTYPPAQSSLTAMTSEQKQRRIGELTEKAISFLSEKDRENFMKLHLIPADKLTEAQYAKRVKYAEKSIALLSEEEVQEYTELIMDMLNEPLSESIANQKAERMGSLGLKGLEVLTEKERNRYLELANKEDLSAECIKELIQFNNKMTAELSEAELEEMRRLSRELEIFRNR